MYDLNKKEYGVKPDVSPVPHWADMLTSSGCRTPPVQRDDTDKEQVAWPVDFADMYIALGRGLKDKTGIVREKKGNRM